MSKRHFPNRFNEQLLKECEIDDKSVLEYALNILESCAQNYPPIEKNYDGGLYVGFVGLSYALLHLSKFPALHSKRLQLLNQAKYFIEQDMCFFSEAKNIKDESKLSFLLGHVGSISIAACVYDQLSLKAESLKFVNNYISFADRFLPVNVHRCGSDELFVGRAGYLAGICLLKSYCKDTPVAIPKEILHGILDSIVNSGQQYSQKSKSHCPLMYAYYNTEYLGAGHGLAGILFMLMKFKEYLDERPVVVNLIQKSLDYMIRVTPANSGNLPPATDDIGRSCSLDSQLVHWCHGAAGAVYAYGRAYYLWHQDIYLQAATRCAEVVWHYGLLKKGPGICHGVAGSGYVFLLMYRLTSDIKYLNQAKYFCDFLKTEEFKTGARVPDSPFSLFEGWAGAACFVADLASPNSSSFPFFDVFD